MRTAAITLTIALTAALAAVRAEPPKPEKFDETGFEKIFDVVWSGDRKPDKFSGVVPPIESTVDIEKGTYTNDRGSTELKAVWSDPEFDASLHAFYYARVLEIPTPRWTAYDAKRFGVRMPPEVPMTTQERAYTSPIWYTIEK